MDSMENMEDFEAMLETVKAGEDESVIIFENWKGGIWSSLSYYYKFDQIGSGGSPGPAWFLIVCFPACRVR
jgi:hypothetical protein